MRSARVDSQRVLARANAQLEGFKIRSGLEVGMPIPADEIAASVAKVGESKSKVESLKQALRAATRAAHETGFELNRKLGVNIVYGELKYGLKSDEVVALGSKVLLKASRSKSKGREIAPPQDSSAQSGASPSDATAKVA